MKKSLRRGSPARLWNPKCERLASRCRQGFFAESTLSNTLQMSNTLQQNGAAPPSTENLSHPRPLASSPLDRIASPLAHQDHISDQPLPLLPPPPAAQPSSDAQQPTQPSLVQTESAQQPVTQICQPAVLVAEAMPCEPQAAVAPVIPSQTPQQQQQQRSAPSPLPPPQQRRMTGDLLPMILSPLPSGSPPALADLPLHLIQAICASSAALSLKEAALLHKEPWEADLQEEDRQRARRNIHNLRLVCKAADEAASHTLTCGRIAIEPIEALDLLDLALKYSARQGPLRVAFHLASSFLTSQKHLPRHSVTHKLSLLVDEAGEHSGEPSDQRHRDLQMFLLGARLARDTRNFPSLADVEDLTVSMGPPAPLSLLLRHMPKGVIVSPAEDPLAGEDPGRLRLPYGDMALLVQAFPSLRKLQLNLNFMASTTWQADVWYQLNALASLPHLVDLQITIKDCKVPSFVSLGELGSSVGRLSNLTALDVPVEGNLDEALTVLSGLTSLRDLRLLLDPCVDLEMEGGDGRQLAVLGSSLTRLCLDWRPLEGVFDDEDEEEEEEEEDDDDDARDTESDTDTDTDDDEDWFLAVLPDSLLAALALCPRLAKLELPAGISEGGPSFTLLASIPGLTHLSLDSIDLDEEEDEGASLPTGGCSWKELVLGWLPTPRTIKRLRPFLDSVASIGTFKYFCGRSFLLEWDLGTMAKGEEGLQEAVADARAASLFLAARLRLPRPPSRNLWLSCCLPVLSGKEVMCSLAGLFISLSPLLERLPDLDQLVLEGWMVDGPLLEALAPGVPSLSALHLEKCIFPCPSASWAPLAALPRLMEIQISPDPPSKDLSEIQSYAMAAVQLRPTSAPACFVIDALDSDEEELEAAKEAAKKVTRRVRDVQGQLAFLGKACPSKSLPVVFSIGRAAGPFASTAAATPCASIDTWSIRIDPKWLDEERCNAHMEGVRKLQD